VLIIRLGALPLYAWGSNSRAVSKMATRLGWVPRGPGIWGSLGEYVDVEIKKLEEA
jgi:hypothetical protein